MNLSKKVWSYSSLKLYSQCPYAFYLRYVEDEPEQANAFAQVGSLVHSILERYFKGELYAFELADIFESEYDTAVTERFPFFNMYKSYTSKSLEYLRTFDGIDGEIVGVEQKLETAIGGYKFVGFADLILRDENGLHLIDHKSHGAWKSKAERKDYFRQLYLYCHAIKEKYGEFPYKLSFNKFRMPDDPLDSEEFHEGDYTAALDWFKTGVEQILSEKEWECKPDGWYCEKLCGLNSCVYRGE